VTETVLSLALALIIIGGVTYGLVAVVKPFIPTPWRHTTKLGKAFMLAFPLLVGGGISVGAIGSIIELVASLTEGTGELDIIWQAEFILGMFSGSFATQIHTAVRSRIKRAAAKAILDDEEAADF
jgi:hypothetical protein